MRREVLGAVGFLFCAAALGGCPSLQDLSSGYTTCRPDEITISDERSTIATRNWVATCHGQRFDCRSVSTGDNQRDIGCNPNNSGYPRPSTTRGEARTATTRTATAPAARSAPAARGAARGAPSNVQSTREANGRTRLQARVSLEAFTLLVRWDAGDSDVAFVMLQRGVRLSEDCQVGLMIDGQLHALEQARPIAVGQEQGYATPLPVTVLRSVAGGSRVAGRVCGVEWRLDDAGRSLLAELVARIDEEGAWSASPASPAEGEAQPGESPTP